MSKFKKLKNVDTTAEKRFIQGAQQESELPWESFFVRANPDITKAFTISLPLEYFMKLEFIQQQEEGRSRNLVIRELLCAAIDKELQKHTPKGSK